MSKFCNTCDYWKHDGEHPWGVSWGMCKSKQIRGDGKIKKLKWGKQKGANPLPKGGTSKKSNERKKQGPQPEVVEAKLHGDKPCGAGASADSASLVPECVRPVFRLPDLSLTLLRRG